MKYPIFLVGFMASGKSSKGKKLAKKLNLEFIDLDQVIESLERSTVSALFAEKGEDYFRNREKEQLQQLKQGKKAVVALGGGTICSEENLAYILKTGTAVYLKLSNKRILGRLRQGRKKRPLIAHLNDEELKPFMEEKMKERSPFYEQAHLIIESDDIEATDIIQKLESLKD